MTYGDYCAQRDQSVNTFLIGAFLIGSAIYIGPDLIKAGIESVKNVFKKPEKVEINYEDLN